MLSHIIAALAAIEAKDVVTARREIGAARRALGLYGQPQRTMDQVAVSIATATSRYDVAECLALAAESMEGDTWPGDEPYDVSEFLASDEPPEGPLPLSVDAWYRDHEIIKSGTARVALATAKAMIGGG